MLVMTTLQTLVLGCSHTHQTDLQSLSQSFDFLGHILLRDVPRPLLDLEPLLQGYLVRLKCQREAGELVLQTKITYY